MSAGNGLLQDLIENPADDVPRLVYADWLEENGAEERADFIRQAIAFPHASFVRLTDGNPFQLLGLEEGEPQPIYGLAKSAACHSWMWGESDFGCVVEDLGRHLDYREQRGFVEGIACLCADWLVCAGDVLPGHPVQTAQIRGNLRDETSLFVDLLLDNRIARLHTLDLSLVTHFWEEHWRAALRHAILLHMWRTPGPWCGLKRLILPYHHSPQETARRLALSRETWPGLEVCIPAVVASSRR
jgi:uncharacterized protein (TIGR02996 family)